MSTLLDSLHDAVVLADLSGTILHANAATESLLGWSAAALAGERLEVIVPPRHREAHRSGFARFAAGGPAHIIGVPMRLPALRPDGHEIAVELLLSTVEDVEGQRMIVGTMRNVQQRLELEQDGALARRLLEIASSDMSMTRAIPLLLESIATGVGWEAAGLWEAVEGEIDLIECTGFWVDPRVDGDEMLDASVGRRFDVGTGLPGRVWEDVVPAWVPELTEDPHFPRGAAARASGLLCGVGVPLVHNQRTVAVLELFRRRADEPESTLIASLQNLSASLASWVDRSRLEERYRAAANREVEVAALLRSTLLPPSLPEPEGFALAATFQPGGDIVVGGDFYDAYHLRNGRLAVTVGDVCGNGPEAAAVSGQVRHTLRALAHEGSHLPSAVFEQLNSLLYRNCQNRFCTAVLGTFRSLDGHVQGTLSSAGHPDPLVVRADGSVESVQCRGRLVGVMPSGTWRDAEVDLARGDALVLFTDGVTEARNTAREFFGEDRVRRVLRSLAGRTPDEIVAGLREAVLEFANATLVDDVAVLALTPSA